jgi:hypothetical protein
MNKAGKNDPKWKGENGDLSKKDVWFIDMYIIWLINFFNKNWENNKVEKLISLFNEI